MRNAFNPLKKQFYVARKLDFQDVTSPKKKTEPDETPIRKIQLQPKELSPQRQRLTMQPPTATEPPLLSSMKRSFQLPPTQYSTKDETQTFFKNQDSQREKEEAHNIFEGILINIPFADINQAERKKYIDYNIGPRFDAEGNIVRWSILGKPDQYTRVQATKKKGVHIGTTQQNQTKKPPKAIRETISRAVSIREDMDESQKLKTGQTLLHQQSSSSDLRLQTAVANQKMATSKGISKKHKSDFKLIPKQDLLQYMSSVRLRMDSNDRTDQQNSEKLAINIRNCVTREGRVLERFENQLEVWDDQRNILSSHCGRDTKTALISRAEGFRMRVENVHGVEVTKSDQEKYSNRFWYLRLRSYQAPNARVTKESLGGEQQQPAQQRKINQPTQSHPQFDLTTSANHKDVPRLESRMQNRFVQDRENEQLYRAQEFIMADIFSGFQTKVIDNPSQQIEIVRKPILCKGIKTSFTKIKILLHRYFRTNFIRIKEHPLQLKKKRAGVTECETDKLILKGNSIYYKELKQLQSDGAPMLAQYQKHEIDKDPDNDDQGSVQNEYLFQGKRVIGEEVLAEDWNTRTLSKTGEHFYPSLVRVKK